VFEALEIFPRRRARGASHAHERGVIFSEDVDYSDPWQFKNFRDI